MKKVKFKHHIRKMAFVITLFAVFICIISFGISDTNIKVKRTQIKELNTWIVNGEERDLTTSSFQYKTDKPVIYYNTITSEMTGKSLYFVTSHMKVNVYLDTVRYYTLAGSSFFNHTSGTAYNIVDIPENMEGKEIRIEVYNCYDDYDNAEKIRFIYGNVSSIYRYIIESEFWDNIINLLLVISACIVLLLSVFLIKYAKYIMEIVYLSLFELFFGIWATTNSALVNIIVFNPSAMNTLAYYSLFLAPLFFLLYVRNSTYGKNVKKNLVSGIMVIHCCYIIVATVLQIANIKDFFQILWIYHLILVTEVFVIARFFIRSYRIERREGKKGGNDILLFVLLAGLVADLISWNITYTYNILFTRLGLLIYTTSILFKYGKKAYHEVKDSLSRNELKQIAYTDSLTGLFNRNAFISRLANIDIKNVTIVSFDLNNLKYYNDYHGHDKGDQLLICMAEKLRKVFGDNAYRIGGDEFEVILENVSQEDLWKMLEQFEAEEESYNNSDSDIFLQAAYGVGYCQNGESINDIMKMADQNMYTHKKFLKAKGDGPT
ncbi:MAG: GGDEF domain-containing protein [Agathobacter sp.]|nr:GGDEF domain-containing protein [Agathobacter sp.]